MTGKYKHNYKVREYNMDYRPGETDLQYYKRLAKVADQRLVRLEELAGLRVDKAGNKIPGKPGFEKVTKYAYDRAMRDLELYGGGNRFNTKPPLNKDGTVDNRLLSEKISDIRAFLSSVTSTKAGIEQVYTERAKTFNQQFGTNYTWQDLADFYQSGDAQKALAVASSETIQRSIGKIMKAKAQMEKDMAKNANITMSKKENKVVYETAKKLLQTNDLDLSILKGVSEEQKKVILQNLSKMEKNEGKKVRS